MAGFSKGDAKRIANSTRYVEKLRRNAPAIRSSGPSGSPLGFYAELTDSSNDKYSWTKIKYDQYGDYAIDANWGSGGHTATSGYAYEVTGSTHCIVGDVVWVYPALGQDFYIFEYYPGLRIANTNESISARSGSTPGSGAATIKNLANGTYANGATVTVYNPFSTAVSSSKYVEIEWCQGYWHITGVDCGG